MILIVILCGFVKGEYTYVTVNFFIASFDNGIFFWRIADGSSEFDSSRRWFVVVSVELSNSEFKFVGEDVWLDIVVVLRDFFLDDNKLIVICTIREGYKGSGKWRSLWLLVMLVSYVEEPKATRE